MPKSYSLYQAKAQLSAIIKQVREGQAVVITVHGKPAAEIRPIEAKPASLEERMAQMERDGTLIRAGKPRRPFRKIADRPGALQRFLDERD